MRKKSIIALVTALIIPIIFCCIFIYDNVKVRKADMAGVIEIDESVNFSIDGMEVIDSDVYIFGWAFMYEPKFAQRSILLRNVDEPDEVLKLNTAMVERTELNEVYGGVDYENAGFVANGSINGDMKNNTYEIMILFEEAEQKYVFETGEYIELGE